MELLISVLGVLIFLVLAGVLVTIVLLILYGFISIIAEFFS